mgnify:CR=1 FL=1
MAFLGMGKISKLLIHQYLVIGLLLVLTAIRLLTGVWALNSDVIFWWIGTIVGFVFVFTDRFVYAFWQEKDEVLSMRLRELFGQGKLWEGLATALRERKEQERLMMRSVLFLATWVFLAIFTWTSVGNPFGRGFMLGLGLHLAFDLGWDYFKKERDVRLWFWQIKRPFSDREIRNVVWGFLAITGFLVLVL